MFTKDYVRKGIKMKTKIIISIIILLLIGSVGYIIYDKGMEYLNEQRKSFYDLGFNEGVNYWNVQVINTIENQKIIPIIINNTLQNQPISQLCDYYNGN